MKCSFCGIEFSGIHSCEVNLNDIPFLRTQVALLVEALEGVVAEMNNVLHSIENEKVHFDGDRFHERLAIATKTLAVVKDQIDNPPDINLKISNTINDFT